MKKGWGKQKGMILEIYFQCLQFNVEMGYKNAQLEIYFQFRPHKKISINTDGFVLSFT